MSAVLQIKSERRAKQRGQAVGSVLRCSRLAVAVALLLISYAAGGAVAAQSGLDHQRTMLVGFGLVIGLAGTGDSTVAPEFIDTTIVGLLARAGLDPWRGALGPGRVAKVMLSAEISGNSRDGMPIDVIVNAIGDAASLAGGTLLAAPLRDSNGKVYAVSQGSIVAGDNAAVVAGQSWKPAVGARGGIMAEGVVLDTDQARELANE